MPSSGKSTIGKILAKTTNKKFYDIDEEIIKRINMDITSYFSLNGEKAFRDIEAEVIKEISKQNNLVIATGGGSIIRKENVNFLKQNGKLIFLDRSLKNLITTSSRPLSSNQEDLNKRYNERYPIYNKICDLKVNGDLTIDEIVNKIIGG